MTTSAIPAEMLARIFYRNDATGAPIRIDAGGATDGNVYLFTGNKSMGSDAGPGFNESGALDTNCFTRDVIRSVTETAGTLRDCPITGAGEFLADALDGYKAQYDAGGDFAGLGIAAESEPGCVPWLEEISAPNGWTIIELVGWRQFDNVKESVRANIFRNVTRITPSRNLQYGLEDPGQGTVDLNIIAKKAGAGWGDGPGDHFALYDDTGGTTLTRDPVTLNHAIGTSSLYEDLITLCSANSPIRGVPLTAALIDETPELDGNTLIATA